MKQKILLCAAFVLAAMLGSNEAYALTPAVANDSTATALRLKGLQTRREKLQAEIKSEDAKRNRQMAGVAPETLEEINDRQDSICLALRSELVDVMLEIKEISPQTAPTALLQQINSLIGKPGQQGAGSESATGAAPEGQPAKKPEK